MQQQLFFASAIIFGLEGFDGTENLNHGLAKFEEKRFEEAEVLLNDAYNTSPDNFYKSVATLYQAKCLLEQGKTNEAEQKLNQVHNPDLKKYPALFYEWRFTNGALAYQKKEWESAAKWLEEALPQKNLDAAEWAKKTQILLLAVYKKLANDPQHSLEKQDAWKKKAQKLEAVHYDESKMPNELNAFLEAKALYEEKKFPLAKERFFQLYQSKPDSAFADASLYWAARSEEQLPNGNPATLYTTLYSSYPSSPFAPEAYFYAFPLTDYLQGGKTAIKHLQKLPTLFPDHPFTLKALYLVALDHTRDRKSTEGRMVTRKDLTQAIDLFQEVEIRFQKLKAYDPVAAASWEFLKNKAVLERAKANYEIAQASQGAKRRIYFEYSEEIFRDLAAVLAQNDPLKLESLYGLSLSQVKLGHTALAKTTCEQTLAHFKENRMQEGYYLSHAYAQLAEIALQTDEPAKQTGRLADLALSCGKNSLSTDEKLSLMILKSDAMRKEKSYDQAMALLSDVVNFEAVSSLRLKAMYLRAEVYEEQERRLLARKQLESLALKSGPWAEKARKKLEEQYGFN